MGGVTVSVRSARPVIGHLRTLGLDVAAVVSAAGADPAAFEDPDARIPHSMLVEIWQQAVRASGDDAFGIHTAEQVRPGAFDVLDYAIRTSATVREGLERLVRYHRILHDAAVVRLDVSGDRARLTHSLPEEAGPLPRHVAEFIVAAWLVVLRQATGTDLAPLEVIFRHAPPEHLDEHQRLFRAPVRFSRSANGLVIPRSLLDVPLVRADPGLSAVLDRYVRETLEHLPPVASLGDRVRHILATVLSTTTSAESMARKLHMSRRTLHRQLEREGTSFRALLDSLRHELAVRYLAEPRMAVSEIAFLLGFSEPSAFHRAFRRWRGVTPAEYRRSTGT